MNADYLRKKLLKNESPFSWFFPTVHLPSDQFIRSQTEKCNNEEETEFQWMRFTLNLLLAYEQTDKLKNFEEALKHIQFCTDHVNSLITANCKEDLFLSLKSVLRHVTLTTEAIIHLAAGRLENAINIEAKIKPLADNPNNKAGLLGLKASIFIQYGTEGHKLALEAAKGALEINPNEAEWFFIKGNAMGRLRRTANGKVSEEELYSIEKAYSLCKNAAYIVHLAQLYSEQSSSLYFSQEIRKSKIFADKAEQLFKEAISVRPGCASIKARVAHGLIRLRNKNIDGKYVKQLLDEVVKMNPMNSMVYHDLGLYYERQNDPKSALLQLQKASDLGNIKAFMYQSTLKWKYGRQDEIILDIKKMLTDFGSKETETRKELLCLLAACYLLIENNWDSAVKNYIEYLSIDPTGKYIEEYRGFDGKKINFLLLIINELYHRDDKKNYEQLLNLVKKAKPECFGTTVCSINLDQWKKNQLKVKRK